MSRLTAALIVLAVVLVPVSAAAAATLNGGPGPDHLAGSPGADTINALDGSPDRVSCGPGRDIVRADPGDQVGRDCERVRRG